MCSSASLQAVCEELFLTLPAQMPGWWAEHWAGRCMKYRRASISWEPCIFSLRLSSLPLLVHCQRRWILKSWCRKWQQRSVAGAEREEGNKQNHLRVLKMYVTCCFASFEWEFSAAQELSGFIFGQHFTQFEDDKAQSVHYLFERKWEILGCYLLPSLSSVKLCYWSHKKWFWKQSTSISSAFESACSPLFSLSWWHLFFKI